MYLSPSRDAFPESQLCVMLEKAKNLEEKKKRSSRATNLAWINQRVHALFPLLVCRSVWPIRTLTTCVFILPTVHSSSPEFFRTDNAPSLSHLSNQEGFGESLQLLDAWFFSEKKLLEVLFVLEEIKCYIWIFSRINICASKAYGVWKFIYIKIEENIYRLSLGNIRRMKYLQIFTDIWISIYIRLEHVYTPLFGYAN